MSSGIPAAPAQHRVPRHAATLHTPTRLQLGPIVLAVIVMLSLILITGAAIKDLIVRGG